MEFNYNKQIHEWIVSEKLNYDEGYERDES